MGTKTFEQIMVRMREKTTEELLEILENNNRESWTDDAFEAIRWVLSERKGVVTEHDYNVGIKGILLCGKDVNTKDNEGRTALMYASELGLLEIAQLLIYMGASINIKADDGMTALMLASKGNHPELVKILIESGADLNLKTEDGRTAMEISKSLKYQEVFEIQEEYLERTKSGEKFSNSLKCYHCGSQQNIMSSLVMCISESQWPIAGKTITGSIDTTHKCFKDYIKIWIISLCSSCRLQTYKEYLIKSKKDFTSGFFTGLIGAIFLTTIFITTWRFWFIDMGFFVQIAYSAMIVFCIITILVSIINYIIHSAKLKKFQQTNIIPYRSDCIFIYEAKKILDGLQKDTDSNINKVSGSFKLPRFHSLEEIKKIHNDYIFHGDPSEKKRKILEITSPTFQGLFEKIKDPELQVMMEDYFIKGW